MPNRPSEPVAPGDIIAAIDDAVDALLAWSTDWHAPLIAGQPNAADLQTEALHHLDAFASWFDMHGDEGIVDQPSIRRLRAINSDIRRLAESIAGRQDRPSAEEYRTLMVAVQAFFTQARRLDRAFAAASSDLDILTGIQNRHAMRRALDIELQRLRRSGRPAILALADLDHFKAINDRYGHGTGDRVLTVAAGRLAENVRAYDQVFRYSGEEFLVLLPDSGTATAAMVLERLRRALDATPVPIADGESLSISASFGAAQMSANEAVDETIERADAALYRAKQAGRNQVILDT